jgi:hypothetical protein
MPSTNAQITHIQAPPTIPPSTHLDFVNSTVEQQRRRNSSIAKLLGGHPLRNQQYEGKYKIRHGSNPNGLGLMYTYIKK